MKNTSESLRLEDLHRSLTEQFLAANGDVSAHIPELHEPPIVEIASNVRASDMTAIFHGAYFDRRFDDTGDRRVFGPNDSDEARQKRIYFLQANQAFFQLVIGSSSDIVIGPSSFSTSKSIAARTAMIARQQLATQNGSQPTKNGNDLAIIANFGNTPTEQLRIDLAKVGRLLS